MMAAMASGAPIMKLVADRLGLALTGGRPTGGGQGRTYHARLGGTPVVVKWGLDPDLPEKIPYLASQIPELLRRDCPVPRILAHGPLGAAGYGWVLERLAGTRAAVLDEALLGDLVALIERLAGVPPGPHRNDLGYWVPATVFEDVAGYWRTGAAMGPEAARFCHRLRAWAGRPPPRYPASNGYVHADLSRGNTLVSGGRLSGIIDTEHLGVGDRAVDLARLAFEWYLQARAGTPGLASGGLARLAALGRSVSGAAGWRVAVAYELISRVGWRSEHQDPVDPHTEVPVCAEFLGEPAVQ
jgi:aminoglycoside phosphotransferase (APT) family kinase protein